MTFTLKELEYLERLKAEYREEYPNTPEEEIRLMAHQALEVRRFQAGQQAPMDEPSKDDKVFLVYRDILDHYSDIIGYIRGSEDDAARYCELHSTQEEVGYIELDQLN